MSRSGCLGARATASCNAPALLVTGVEVIPTKKLRALATGKIETKEAAARAALVAPPLPPPPPAPPPVQVFALQSLSEAIVTTDVEGRLVYLNPAAEKLLGIGRAQAAGRLPSGDPKACAETLLDMLDGPCRRLQLGREDVFHGRSPEAFFKARWQMFLTAVGASALSSFAVVANPE